MNPFDYPDTLHARSQDPGPFRDYHKFKPFLQREFSRQCVYCRLPDGMPRSDSFGVDHYRPVSKFPDLRCDYGNLFYACNACNRRKGSFWPDERQWAAGLFVPNPCDHVMAEHLSYRGVRVEPRTPAGRLACELLMLNDQTDLEYRRRLWNLTEACLHRLEGVLTTIGLLDEKLLTAQGSDRKELLADRALLEERFIHHRDDLEFLTGSRLETLP